MAALEKIRKRAAILTIVIGAGLLAFILEEAVRASGAFRTDTVAAKVGDEKIEMQEFQNLTQRRQQNQDPDAKTDPAVTQQNILQEVIAESLLSQECDEANIVVTGSEVSELMVKNPPQSIANICNQNGIDPKSLLDLLKNPNADPNDQGLQQVKALYEEEAQNMASQLKQAKLAMVLSGCLQANDIDIELTKEESTVYDVTYAKVDYTTVDDKQVKVTDADLKAAYDKYKALFKLDEEARRVHYIKVDVDPSSQDKAAAAKKIAEIYAKLQSEPGINGVRSNSEVILDSVVTTATDKQVFTSKKPENKDELFNTLIAGGVGNVERKDPTGRDRNTLMYKLTSLYQSIDSVGLDMVMVQGPKARQDSVFALLQGGMAIDSLAGNANIQIQKSNGQNLARGFQFPDSMRTKINANTSGSYFLWQGNDQGAIYAKVAESKPAITFYNIARAKYVNYPSEATNTKLTSDLQAYMNKNKDIKNFEKNAKAAKYEMVEEIIYPGTTQLGAQQSPYGMMPGIPESRKAIKWAFENKPGTISQIFADDNALIVVAVDEIYKDYLPMTDPNVKQQLTALVTAEKKGEYLMKQYNGKANDLAGYAALMKTEIDSASVTMGAPQQMLESKVAGLIAGLGDKAKGKVQLVAGRNAIYAVQVNNKTAPRELPKQQIAAQYRQQHFPIQQMLGYILQNSRKVKNNLIKFS